MIAARFKNESDHRWSPERIPSVLYGNVNAPMAKSAVLLHESWNALRSDVETALEQYVESVPGCPEQLAQAMSYSLLAGGKRLRPILVLLACEACGGDSTAAMPAACAIEMVHTYSLIHDDLPAMDDDDLRRGRPTNHVVHGEATAILAGDALLTLAFEVLASDIQPPRVAAACCADLASAAGRAGMVGGQIADLEAETLESPTLEQLEQIHRRKTGRLLTSALTLGGRIAQANDDAFQALTTYGQCLGLAFQITDDLLDIAGDAKTLGKSTGKDVAQGKLTYPALLGVEESQNRARSLINQACRNVEMFGDRGQRLEALARFVLERDH
ncbi:Farnesyl diphosphate synthase [Symmachiella dynata]|nr:Farnesyl diphosphate synthase [Symmachiella dynata]